MWSLRFFATLVLAFWLASLAQAAAPCDEFAARLPNVKRSLCESASLQPCAAKSVQGRPIWTRDIKADNATWRVLVIGAIHGDELSSASVALHWLKLAELGPVDMPQAVHWRFIPALNPDGLLS